MVVDRYIPPGPDDVYEPKHMVVYGFECADCKELWQAKFPMGECPAVFEATKAFEADRNTSWWHPTPHETCLKTCSGEFHRTYRGMPPPAFKIKGHSYDKERKINKHMKWVESVMAEPACASEIKEGKDMIKEREKEKGLPEGTLSGNRPHGWKDKTKQQKRTELAARAKSQKKERPRTAGG